MSNLEEFRALGLSGQMLAAVAAKGFETPSPIQKLSIPALLGGENDIIAQAQTGTGKTAAFGLPILERLTPSKEGVTQALILAPTRELALQVTEELLSFNSPKLSIAPIYGGASISEQLRRLKKGIDVVVGTPGRILDHIGRGTLDLSALRYLVLDEADEMLNMGFIEDIEAIMAAAGDDRRVMLFSATMPPRIAALAKKYMRQVEHLKVESQHATVDLTDQIYFEVREGDKFDALTRIIDVEPDFYGIVFSRTRNGVDEMVARLLERGYAAEGLHGDVSQAQREKTLKKFRKKQTNILVATDVAARGIDIDHLTHVINYSLPQDSESYVHRIGRTGRAGREGTAITFISPSELRRFGFLKRDIGADITKATLPTAQDVVATKRGRIKDELNDIIENGNYEEYMEMASELLGGHPAPVAMSALLRMAFKNELSENKYPEIRSIDVDRRGKARLFIAIGRYDGYDARKLVDLLKRECGLRDSNIDEVHVKDAYSFVTVPFSEAEETISRLNAIRHGDRPLASLAGDRTTDEGGAAPAREARAKRKEAWDGEKPAYKKKPFSPGTPAGENDDFFKKSKKPARPAYEDDSAAPKPVRAAKPAPAKAKAKPAEDEIPSVSAGGFDWTAFEASLPGDWERDGSKKGKRGAARAAAAAPAKAARPGHGPKGTPKRTAAKGPKPGKMTAKIRSKR